MRSYADGLLKHDDNFVQLLVSKVVRQPRGRGEFSIVA